MARHRTDTATASLVACLLLAGCIAGDGPSRDEEADGARFAPDVAALSDGSVDAGPGSAAREVTMRSLTAARPKMDVLHVVDDSGSMCEEQRNLARAFGPAMRDIIEQMPDADWRFAVVSTDMHPPNGRIGRFLAAPAPPVPSLNCRGEDGEAVAPDTADCAELLADGLLPPILRWNPEDEAADVDELARRFRCMVTLGTQGDGFEKGLEAMRTALSCDGPNSEFFGGCCAGGVYDPACPDDPDFLRPDATLVVVFLSDENDCSDTPDDPVSRSDNSNCEWMRDKLVPVDDYKAFLLGVKAGRARRLVVVPIVGMRQGTESGFELSFDPGPPEPVCDPQSPEFDPDAPLDRCCPEGRCRGPVQPACESANGVAFSGTRYLDLAGALGDIGASCPLDQEELTDDCAHICVDDAGRNYERMLDRFANIVASYCLFYRPDPVDPQITVTVADEVLAANAFELLEERGCRGGAYIRLRDQPPPSSLVTIRYRTREPAR